MPNLNHHPPRNKLTSRERVLKAIRHEEPDRLPIDLGGIASTGIMAIAYDRLMRHLGLPTGQIRVFDIGQQLAEVAPALLARFGADVISLENSMGAAQPGLWKPWTLPNGVPCQVPAGIDLRPDRAQGGWHIWENGLPVQRMSESSLYFTQINHPLAGLSTPEELLAVPRPILTDETLAYLQMKAKNLYEHTDFAIMASFGGSILETGQNLRGWGQFMMDLAAGGAFTEDLIEGIVETHHANLTLFLEAVGDYIQIIQFGDDLGTQDRPQMSLPMYRKYIKPGHQKLYQYVHKNSDCAVFLHSCGSIRPLIPDLIEAGVDILNPVQTSAAGMDAQSLKAEFGHQITFWGGGCDTQKILPHAAPAEIIDHVNERIDIFAPGGGFVFNQIHNIQADVPPENIVAMFDTALAFHYPEAA
jgi:uroporphyrinogen decarboxylase